MAGIWRLVIAGATVLHFAAACGDDTMDVPSGSGSLTGRVAMSGPVSGAAVTVEQLDLDTGEVTATVGTTTADAAGAFTLDTGAANGLVRITARGGSYTDLASGERIELDADAALETVIELDLLEERTGVRIAPVGHLVAARMRAAIAGGVDARFALETAAEHVNRHFGNVDWERTEPAPLAEPAPSPTEPVRAALVEAALSYLAADIAGEAGASPQDVTVAALVHRWADDLEADGLFDGNDGNDRARARATGLQLGACNEVDAGCEIPSGICADGACRPLCDLYVGSARALLGGTITKVIYLDGEDGRPLVNGTQLNVADILPVARSVSDNVDEYLFGTACVETLDRTPPTIAFDGISPADGVVAGGTVMIRAVAIDDLDMSPRIELVGYVDEDGDAANNAATTTIDTTLQSDGPLTVMAAARDQAGNRSMALRTFVTDNTPPSLAFTSTGFFVDGATWWTTTDAPTLTGTVVDNSATTVTAFVGAESVPGTVTGGTWSVTLPSGLLAAAGTDVRVVAEDVAGNVAEASQRFRADATPPELTPQATGVKNEDNDTVTFETDFQVSTYGSPRHAHGGTPTQLDVTGSCPTVIKHSYLLGVSSPPFVTEPGGRNPIAYQAVAADDGVGIEPGSTQFRVGRRDAGGTPVWLLDWTGAGAGTEIAPGARRHDVSITAPQVTGLDTTEGTYDVELRTSDRLGRMATVARCFTLQLRAPQLYQASQGPATSVRALSKLSLSPTAGQTEELHTRLLNGVAGETGASLIEQRLVNGTTSPVYLTVRVTRPQSIQVGGSFVLGNARSNTQAVDLLCTTANGNCTPPTSGPSVQVTLPTTVVMIPELPARVFSANGGALGTELALTSFTPGSAGSPDEYRFVLPARTTSALSGPREFVVMTTLGQQMGLWPEDDANPQPPPYSLETINGVTITGRQSSTSTGCIEVETIGTQQRCKQRTSLRPYRALRSASITFATPGVKTSIFSAATATLAPRQVRNSALLEYAQNFSTTEPSLPPNL